MGEDNATRAVKETAFKVKETAKKVAEAATVAVNLEITTMEASIA